MLASQKSVNKRHNQVNVTCLQLMTCLGCVLDMLRVELNDADASGARPCTETGPSPSPSALMSKNG
jgi:hypothetical protein